jgi:hypothetical protein
MGEGESVPLKRNDRHLLDATEGKLIRIGHHIVRESRRKGVTAAEEALLWEAAALVWAAKREYRAELAVRRKAKADEWVERIRNSTLKGEL